MAAATVEDGDLVYVLQQQGDHYLVEIESQKQRIDRLERDLEHIKKMEDSKKARDLSEKSVSGSPKTSARRVQMREARLVIDLQNLSNLTSTNAILKSKINTCRNERRMLLDFLAKVEAELLQERNELKHLLDKIEHQNDRNLSLKQKNSALGKQIRDERTLHQRAVAALVDRLEADEIRSRNTKISLERRRKKNMNTSFSSMQKNGNEENEVKGEQMNAGVQIVNKDVVSKQEVHLKHRKTKGAWKIAKQKAQLKLSSVKIRNYETAFLKILSFKSFVDVNEVVREFVKLQKEDSVLIERLNQLNVQVAEQNSDVQALWKEIDERRISSSTEENTNQRIVRELEEKIMRAQDRGNQFSKQYKSSEKVVHALKSKVPLLATNLGCMPSVGLLHRGGSELHRNNSEMTDGELIQTIGNLERRSNEIVELNFHFQKEQLGDEMAIMKRTSAFPTAESHKPISISKYQLDDIVDDRQQLNVSRRNREEGPGNHQEAEKFQVFSRGEIEFDIKKRLGII